MALKTTKEKTLVVKNFSCIEKASFQINDLTLIIGPQASGKSVLCKLFYFFHSIPDELPRWVQDVGKGGDLKERILERFSEWFPPSSWGSRQFSIIYSTGEFSLTITKSRSRDPKAKLVGSKSYDDLFNKLVSVYKSSRESKAARESAEVDGGWRLYTVLDKTIDSLMGDEKPLGQLFIPAGRSFFTSVGKIVAAFEAGGILDPVVSRFGRLVTQLREHAFFEGEPKNKNLSIIEGLIGGHVIRERGREFLSTPDGRNIPFSALSSGQQELLPLFDGLRFSQFSEQNNLVYIEEPEAHLFPSAQTDLVGMFAQLINSGKKKVVSRSRNKTLANRQIVLTTHSPYVLAKINNLIKAGDLGSRVVGEKKKAIEKIVDPSCWISPRSVSAYKIVDGKLSSIIDDYGLIDGDYIDSVSAATGIEFDALIDIEVSL